MKKYNDSSDYTLYNENCVDVMLKFPHCADLIVTSPPYDKLRKYQGYEFNFQKVALGCIGALKEGGVLVWVVADSWVDGSQTCESLRQAIFFTEWGMKLHDTMIYSKNSQGNIAPNRYRNIWEYMFVFSKGKPKTTNILRDRKNVTAGAKNQKTTPGKIPGDKNGSGKDETDTRPGYFYVAEYGVRENIWRYNTGGNHSAKDNNVAYKHPAIFPIDLARDHILSWSNPGDVVLDPMSGSGTTMRAALELGRIPMGIEISEEYCEIIVSRMSQPSLEMDVEEDSVAKTAPAVAVESGKLF